MEIELVDGIESISFEIKDDCAELFIKKHLDKGANFDIFFPDYEIKEVL